MITAKRIVSLATTLSLLVSLGACSSSGDEQEQLPEVQYGQTQQQLIRLNLDRNCPDFEIWCAACGTCIKTDKVCNSDFCPDRDNLSVIK